MDEKQIEALVREVLVSMNKSTSSTEVINKVASPAEGSKKLTVEDYPLQEKRPELIKSNTGKSMDELTLKAVMNGSLNFDDFRINPVTLEYQAQIAEAAGRPQLAENLRRAKELTVVPDDEILSLYNSLRPYRSTKDQLIGYADHLEKEYKAIKCAQLFREAAEVYEKRGMLA